MRRRHKWECPALTIDHDQARLVYISSTSCHVVPGEVLEEHVDRLLGLALCVSLSMMASCGLPDLELVAWGFLATL